MSTDHDHSFGQNLVSIRQMCGWTRETFVEHLTTGMSPAERRHVRALVWLAEERGQRRSRLIEPLSRVFDIPVKSLAGEDLTVETRQSLHEKFGFDPREVVQRAAGFAL